MEAESAPLGKGRLLASLTLLEWGVLLVYFYCSGRLTSLLIPSFHLLVLVTGILLCASGALLWWSDEKNPAEQNCVGGCCEHSHTGFGIGRFLSFLVLSVPVALAAVISPDSYGSVMIRNRGVIETVEKVADTPITPKHSPSQARPNDEPVTVEVGDLLIAAQSKSGMAQYDGKRVELTGQVYPLGEGKFELVRMLMLCCAADAQMLVVRVESDHDFRLPAMKWAKITGRVSFAKKGDHDIPVVAAEKVMPIAQPADPYVYRGGSLPAATSRGSFKLQLPPR